MANFYNPSEGTWLIKGEFNNSVVLDGSGVYVNAVSGNGVIVITYDSSGANVYSGGEFQYSTSAPPSSVNGEGIVLVKNGVATVANTLFIPRKYSENEAVGAAIGGVVMWTPEQLFLAGQQGVWYEPKPEYLYQDAAGTIPVENSGDPVGYMQDLSGNNNHATQSTSAARPIYKTDGVLHYLEFDGVDDQLIASQGVASTIGVSSVVAFLTETDGYIVSQYETAAGQRSWYQSVDINSGRYRSNISDDGTNFGFVEFSSATLNTKKILSTVIDPSQGGTDKVKSYVLGTRMGVASSSGLTGITSLNTNGTFVISGRFNSTVVTNRMSFYGNVVSSEPIDDGSREQTEAYLANLAGVTIP